MGKIKFLKTLCFACAFLSAALCANASLCGAAGLKSNAVINKSEITADCLVASEVEPAFKSALSEIYLGYIAEPLGEVVLQGSVVAKKLGCVAGRLVIPETITVRRSGSFLSGSEVAEKIKKLCGCDLDPSINVDCSKIESNILLPGTLKSFEVIEKSKAPLGMRLFLIEADTDSGPFKQVVRTKVSKKIEAAELICLVKPHTTITSDKIRPKAIEISSNLSNLPVSYKDAVGKTAARYKSAGTILREKDIAKSALKSRVKHQSVLAPAQKNTENFLINKGDRVEYLINSGSLSVKVPAKAIEGGFHGDEIELLSLQSRKKIRGTITGKGRVEYAQN